MNETKAWVEPIEGYSGYFRLCLQSGDCQSRLLMDAKGLQSLIASAMDARAEFGRARGRGGGGNR